MKELRPGAGAQKTSQRLEMGGLAELRHAPTPPRTNSATHQLRHAPTSPRTNFATQRTDASNAVSAEGDAAHRRPNQSHAEGDVARVSTRLALILTWSAYLT